MKRIGIALSTGCAIALVAALVPAVASGVNVEAPGTSSFSIDDRKKPKPTKKPQPKAPVPIQAKHVGDWVNRNWDSLDKASPTFQYFVDPLVQGSPWEADTLSGAAVAFGIHEALGYPIEREFRVYMGWDHQWIADNLPPEACSGGFWGPASMCWGTNVILANFKAWRDFYYIGYTPESGPRPDDRIHVVGQLPHELTHMVQEEISPWPEQRIWRSNNYWLLEGWAMLVQGIAAAKIYNMPYVKMRDYNLQSMGSECKKDKLKDMLDKKSPRQCEYLSGLLAMEYLVWKTGDMAAGLTYMRQDAESAHEAFRLAFSLDLDAFMAEADRYVQREIALWPLRKNAPK